MNSRTFSLSFDGQEYTVWYVKDTEEAVGLVDVLSARHTDLCGIDIETAPKPLYRAYPDAGLSPHLADIRLIQACLDDVIVVFDMAYMSRTDFFLPWLMKGQFIAHNAVFELGFFRALGVQKMNIGCTMLLAKLLMHATRPNDMRVGLKELCENVLQVSLPKELQASNWAAPELTYEQVCYAALDAAATLKLAFRMAHGLEKFGMSRIYKLHKDVQHPVVEMQINGLGIDKELHHRCIDVWRNDLYAAKKELLEKTGLRNITGHTVAEWLEEHLPPDVFIMWPRTPTGKLRTDAHVFADYPYIPIAEGFGRYQKLEKLSSSFGINLAIKINPATSRIHASYNIGSARTGRMSCNHPNLQQFPHDLAYRAIFVPRPGYAFVCADFDQIEIRIGAEISRDKAMLDAYSKGIDIHRLTAAQVSRKRIEDVDSDDRKKGKSFNFGLMFGLGAEGYTHYARKLYNIETTLTEAQKDIERWRELYAGYRAWQIQQAEVCSQIYRCTTPLGKVRRLDAEKYYGAGLNTPIQGGAAEAMNCALVNIHPVCLEKGYYLANCVHDEILLECPNTPEQLEACIHDVRQAMVEGFKEVFPYGITHNLVSVGHGENWGNAK